MAKLYFRYGAMGSSKTANALMVKHNYMEKGMKVLFLKPAIENRDGKMKVKSRIGIESYFQIVEDFFNDKTKLLQDKLKDVSCVIVDEAQFLDPLYVDVLADTVVDYLNIPVICYGLRTDFEGYLFDGSKRLMEVADVIEEIPTVCWCGKKAKFNARICNGKKVTSGEQIMMGGNESYVSLCRKHFKEGKIANED